MKTPPLFRVVNATRGRDVAVRVTRADGFLARAIGLLSRTGLEDGEGLWIEPCAQIHTFFMGFPIDAVFLDSEMRVVRVYEKLVPWRVSAWIPGARSVLELAANAVKGRVAPGDVLEFHGN